jgi:tRNA(Ile)-lysidine synthase
MPISLQTFTAYVQKHGVAAPAQKILLAFSGGIDSVVMAILLKDAGYNFALAHCNFSLRGDESDGDEDFARTFAQNNKIPFYTTRFDTQKYCKQKKVSIQMGARQLRYNWFYEVMEKEGYELLATAHHQTDQVETMLQNITRGAGLAGLQGMKPKEGNLIRPLLFATRPDIEAFAKQRKLKWREDSSNRLNKYSRNKLRNVVLPVLKGLNPNYEESFTNLSLLVGDYRQLLQQTIAEKTATIVEKDNDTLKINKAGLLALTQPRLYLYELLRPYEFNSDVVQQMAESLAGHSGTIFYGDAGQALIDREDIIVRAHETAATRNDFMLAAGAESFVFAGKQYTVQTFDNQNYQVQKDPAIAQLDADKLEFPLLVRSWQKGDYFYPLGMRKKKKVSDFFVDQKIPVFNKPAYPLLFSGSHLVCIAGLRVDDRYKVTPNTQTVIIIKPAG